MLRHIRGIYNKIGWWIYAWGLIAVSVSTATAQGTTIQGKVVLEQSGKQLVTGATGRYQTSKSGSSRGSSRLADSIILWLEGDRSVNSRTTVSDKLKVLDQRDKSFEPKLMAVRVGDAVKIENSDPIYHNVFSLSSTKRFDVGRRPPGDYEKVQFDKSGIVDVFCDIHSDMHAVIVVMPEKTVAWKKMQGSGDFRLTNIPEGEYTLHLYADGDRERSVEVSTVDTKKVTLKTIRLGS